MKLPLFLFTALLSAFVAVPFASSAPRPNVLLIMVDDLNYELGCYGSKSAKSPHIDSFAASATRFTRAYCQAPLCNPSRTSMLTGLRPESIGVIDNNTHFRWKRPDIRTLPQKFQAAGWRAEAYGKIFHGGSTPIEDGASWDAGPGTGKPLPVQPAQTGKPDRNVEPKPDAKTARQKNNPWDNWGAIPGGDTAAGDGKFSRSAAAAMKRMKDAPFFLAVGFKKPHAPLMAPEAYFAMHTPQAAHLPKSFRYPDEPPITYLPAVALRPNFDLFGPQRTVTGTRDEALSARAAYAACVSYIDAQVGIVLDTLDELGLRDNTIVIFVSDHGFHLGEHGLWSKMTLLEESLRAPMMIRAPGIAPGVCGRVVELLDIYPTTLDLAGLPAADHAEGRSLAPLMRQPDREWPHPAYAQLPRQPNLPGGARMTEEMGGRSVHLDRWHYVRWNGGEEALFDLTGDPFEMENLVGKPEHDATLADMRKRMEAYPAKP
ncbi:sulfatase [Akkermansiaceae bacterium]|nr:sulfatase [Akkermansiaceae bacterium]